MNTTDETAFETPPDPDDMVDDEPAPRPVTTDPEVPEADAWEQSLEVPYDEDDERP